MSDFSHDLLAQRIGALESRVDAERIVRNVLSSSVRPRSRRWIALTAVATPLVLAVATTLSSYYAPAFAQAVADAPVAGSVTGWMLRSVGLAGIPHRLSSFGDNATSQGYRVELAGGYADSGRTILFARVSPPGRVAPGVRLGQEMTLSDQFGASYHFTGAAADLATGENVLIFEPLRWPASAVGARLRLSFNTLEVGTPPWRDLSTVTGEWPLNGTLAVETGRVLDLPDGGNIGPMRVSFTNVRAMSSALLVEMRITTGGLDLQRVIPDAGKGRSAFTVTVTDAGGSERPILQSGFGGADGTVEGAWMWLVDQPGRYELRVTYEGAGSIVRTLDVP